MEQITKTKVMRSNFYGTGKFWIFENGQPIEEQQRDCYSLQIIDGKVTGLYYWNENKNQQRLNSCCYSIYNLTGTKKVVYDMLNDDLN